MLLNADKSDAIVLSTTQQAGKLPANSTIQIAGCDIKLSDAVRNLGIVIDNRLSFDEHVSNVCRSCYYHIYFMFHYLLFIYVSQPRVTNYLNIFIVVGMPH